MEPNERLKLVREKMFKTAKDAAEAIGMSYVTYQAHETGRNGFSHMATKYAKFFGTSVDYLLTGKHPSPSAQPVTPVNVQGGGMAVKGFVRAGIWQESYTPEGEVQTLPITADTRFPAHLQFALEIQGDSINRRARAGEYAVCVEWHGPVAPGDLVVVERRRAGLFESTVKVAKLGSGDTLELWPDSDHPNHQQPIVLKSTDVRDGEEISVVAKVLGFYRRA